MGCFFLGGWGGGLYLFKALERLMNRVSFVGSYGSLGARITWGWVYLQGETWRGGGNLKENLEKRENYKILKRKSRK